MRWHRLQNAIIVKTSMVNRDNDSDMNFVFEDIDEELLLQTKALQNSPVMSTPDP